jgi:hypothetical protein
MDKEEFHWLCGVIWVDFQQNLGWKSYWWTIKVSKTSVATDSPRHKINRNQPLLLFHMDPTNTIVWTRKSFIGSVVSYGLIFSKTWVGNNSGGPHHPAVSTISLATNSHRDITKRNQPLLLFHRDPTNSIVWTRKSFIGSVMSCGVDFQQNLG